MPDFTTQAVAMIGIGVGIDYALLIVTRYRAGAARRPSNPRARSRSRADTAGRSVLFAGTTVVIAVLGMLADRRARGARASRSASSLGVLMTMLAAITLLPGRARLRRATTSTSSGFRTSKRAEGEARESFWYRWSRFLQRRPWPAAIAGLVILVRARAAGAVACGWRSPTPATGRRPTRPARAYDLLVEGFGPGFNGPMILAVDMPGGQRRCDALSSCRSALNEHAGRGVRDAAAAERRRRTPRSSRCSRTRSPQSEETAEPGGPPARRRDPAGHARDGRRREGRRPHRRRHRLLELHGRAAPAVHRAGAAAVVPAAHGRVPEPAGAAQGRDHEPAVDRRGVRRDRRRVPVGLAEGPHRRGRGRARSRRGRR